MRNSTKSFLANHASTARLHHRLKAGSRKNRHDYQRRRFGRLVVAAAWVIHAKKNTPNTPPKLLPSRGAGNAYAGEICCTTEVHDYACSASSAGFFPNAASERSPAQRRESELPKSVACALQTVGPISLSATNPYLRNLQVAATIGAVAMQQESARSSPAPVNEHPQPRFLPVGCVPCPDYRRCWQSAATRHSRWLRCDRGRHLGQPKPREPTPSAAGTEPD